MQYGCVNSTLSPVLHGNIALTKKCFKFSHDFVVYKQILMYLLFSLGLLIKLL